ncbi:PAS domain S-box-containing protein [Mucilaginibacter frigoritolerans]|uniref:PAS domain S-box-containing protein n=1 Tax=Mucilaginibacter frigoritolerans TaxID=652788 RepID=A0A562UAU1_9SPHI|nr:response regulator [Mucilaginibacter frigoritolerans]TWJ02475.1 PAS domain S-box-containing protein [Mucilaginibacter frigoritolerans]
MAADKRSLHILIVEDNHGDYALIEDFLFEQIESTVIIRAENYNEARKLLSESTCIFDIILLDLSLPDMKGEPLIKGITELCANTPVIVLTGYTDFAFGVKSLSLGVSDYMLKEELTPLSLYKSIIYSSERKRITADLAESEKKYSELFHLSPLPIWVYDVETLKFLNVNKAAIIHYGYSHTEFLSMTLKDIEIRRQETPTISSPDKNGMVLHGVYEHKKKNDDIIQVDLQSNPIFYRGKKANVVLANDVTERITYIKAIEKQNEKLREISWIQSHIVRAPLARIMGLVPLLKDLKPSNKDDKETMLEYLWLSANELDELIKNITDKTRAADYQITKNGY